MKLSILIKELQSKLETGEDPDVFLWQDRGKIEVASPLTKILNGNYPSGDGELTKYLILTSQD